MFEFTAAALAMLEGLSAGGRDYLETQLRKALELQPTQTHVHAGGMCLLLEWKSERARVLAASPACLVEK